MYMYVHYSAEEQKIKQKHFAPVTQDKIEIWHLQKGIWQV